MADVDIAMLEPVPCPTTAKTKALTRMATRPRRECRQRKRPFDSQTQFNHHFSKRVKCELSEIDERNSDSPFALDSDTDDENDTESKGSTSDTEQTPQINLDLLRQFDENSDIEDYDDNNNNNNNNDNNNDEPTNQQTIYFSKMSTDQHANIPVVANQSSIAWQQPPWTHHSRRLMRQFKYFYDHSLRKAIEPTRCSSEQSTMDTEEIIQNKIRWELRNTFNRLDLFKEGYSVLSNEPFPFHSLCFMCGSMGSDLIYCNSCCEAYHSACLNELERPRLCPTPDSWLCPNCNVCNICGLLSHPSRSLLEQCSQLISCCDCQRNFHIKCIKRSKDGEQLSPNDRSFRFQSWFCPSCIKCDCGEILPSNERNLLSLNKSFSAQQSLMCNDCLNNMKILRMKKADNIEKCHLCDRFIEQLISKSQPPSRPLFSMALIGDRSQQIQQQSQRTINLLQCVKCKHRYHPKCDGYLNEDATLVPHIKTICLNIVCSKCDLDERNKIKKYLTDYKLQVVKNTIASITSTLQIMISEDHRLNDMQRYMCHLQQLHQSRNNSLNLHAFLNDLLIVVRRLLSNIDMRRWQAAIDGCIMRQCPWFKSSSSVSSALLCSSSNATISTHSHAINRCSTPASSDHNYAMNSERIFLESSVYTNNLLSSSDSLIRFMDNKTDEEHFSNLHNLDTRKCQLCQTFADRLSPHIGRLVSIGLNQWVHVGCILPAYAKSLDEPPYILRNIRETVLRCQSKYVCSICSKMGATVQCMENECISRFHCDCIQKYYSAIQQQFNLINGLFPNLTTLCAKHNGINGKKATATHRDSSDAGDDVSTDGNDSSGANGITVSKSKSVNLSSTVYGDLSCNIVEFPLADTHLCIGSLQIDSLGTYDYLLDNHAENVSNNDNVTTYPNNYCASRLYWSTKHARTKTVYHLRVQIEQTYHNELANHQTIVHPMSNEQLHIQQLYDTCRKYFDELQRKIDEHQRSVDRLCQKTIVSKKSKAANNESQNPPFTGTDKKKTTNAGSGNTKKTKETPSCVKRQTPKSALKNVTRPRNRFGNENLPQTNTGKTSEFNHPSATTTNNNNRGSLTMKPTNYHKTPERTYKPGESIAIDTKELRNFLNDDCFKPSNMSFAMALAQALQQIGQSLPTLATKPQQEPILSYYLPGQMNSTANGSTNPKNPSDLLFEQLLKTLAQSQPIHPQASTTSHYRSTLTTTTSTSSTQTTFIPTTRSFDGPSPHSHSSSDGTSQLPYVTEIAFNLSHNKPCIIPQMDGVVDDDDEHLLISTEVLNSLLESIVDNEDHIERMRVDSENSLDLSAGVTPPQLDFTSISPNRQTIPVKESTPPRKKLSIDDLIISYKQWCSSKSGRVTFTITSDDGYKIVSDDLDQAWSTIVNLVRDCRDDMNLSHLPMSNTNLNGHRAFGLCKTVVKTMLNQSLPSQLPQIGTTILPLSSSNNNAIWLLKTSNNENSNQNSNNDRQRTTKKKNNNLNNHSNKVTFSCSRSGIYERKRRGRQRFGWLLNQSRKIEYAQKTFEIDDALVHARRVILEEASVSLRLHHLHYFSERSLLVGSSPIHGCGLFTLIDLVEGQMIVEYTGEVVRPCLTDKRERENEGKGFGCYMFTVDTMHVIDATNRGNKARFINHNCQPNCFAKTVLSGGVKHIVIYALTDVPSGSELTYDYSFPEEDIKIPCHCGTSKCRVYLN